MVRACVAVAAMLVAAPAFAQGAGAGSAGPVINLWYGGLVTGSASAEKTGGVIGAEAGARVWRYLDVSLEVGSLSNVVSQGQLDRAQPLTAFLTQTQGLAADVAVKRPALYGGINARWVLEDIKLVGWARPYVELGIGGARVKRESTFTLGGADITSSLEQQYGVKLGADFIGTERRATVSGGGGVLVPIRMFYVDAGYRLMTIRTTDAVNVHRFNIGVGARF
jgi:opacity protein-like surface antigen